MMTGEQELLIKAVRASITGELCEISTEPDWELFLKLTNSHGLSAMAYDGLKKSGIPLPEQVDRRLQKALAWAVFRDARMEYIKEQLQIALEDSGVDHIFLKGSVLKHSYPVPALRTMSDLDILVYAADFDKIAQVAQKVGGESVHGDGNHRNYVFPGAVAVEFHPNLLHHATVIGSQINPGWQYVQPGCDRCAKLLTEEGFYLSVICHLAEHFIAGGVGVRFVLDIWVNRHLRKEKMDRTFVEAELTRFGLLEFTRKIEELSDVWFGNAPKTPLTEELGEYILTSGSHGNSQRAMLNALSLSDGGNRRSALLKKAFYPKAELEDRYPWCKGKAWLLPAAWCARACKAVTVHGNLIVKWSRDTGKIKKDEIAENRKKLNRFGIR